MNALAPALQKYKLFTVPEVLEQSREERTSSKGGLLIYSICKIKYTFYAEDGTFVTATVIGEGMDSSDKATNKAMSAAFKYACFQTFCIPTEEMVDSDSECHEVKPKEEKKESPYISAAELKKDGIPETKICEWYKVTTLENLTKAQLENLRNNWQTAIDTANKAKETSNG